MAVGMTLQNRANSRFLLSRDAGWWWDFASRDARHLRDGQSCKGYCFYFQSDLTLIKCDISKFESQGGFLCGLVDETNICKHMKEKMKKDLPKERGVYLAYPGTCSDGCECDYDNVQYYKNTQDIMVHFNDHYVFSDGCTYKVVGTLLFNGTIGFAGCKKKGTKP